MAGRQNKVGLDYFELDCHMEEKVRLIQAEFGLKGFAIVVKLYQKIYGELGYYCEWDEDSLLLFMSENGLSRDSEGLITEIVSACIRRNIFSDRLLKEYGILTSSGVQKQYLKATAKREVVSLKKEYLLISVPENKKNVAINSISGGRNSISGGRNKQSRVEKSRVENNPPLSPLGEKRGRKSIPPTPEEVSTYCRERGNGIDGEEFCDYYTSRGWMVGKCKMKDWQAAVRTWEKKRGFRFSQTRSTVKQPDQEPKPESEEPESESEKAEDWWNEL